MMNIVEKHEYLFCLDKVYVFLFLCCIFSNFALEENILLSDLIYGTIASCFFVKGLFLKKSYRYLYIVLIIFFFIALFHLVDYGDKVSFFSQVRFVFNFFIFVAVASHILSRHIEKQKSFIFSYEVVCAIFASFVILQFCSFYLLGINIPFDFGSFEKEANAASLYNPLDGLLYRTGGFFKEPSWFAVFMAPVLDISYKLQHTKIFVICLSGMIFSTSNLGFLLIFMFFLFRMSKPKYVLGLICVVSLAFCFFPIVFERLLPAIENPLEAGTTTLRVLEPFELLFSIPFLLLGGDLSVVYSLFPDIFLNTMSFIYLSFGIVGVICLLSIMYTPSSILISVNLILVIIVEGCYGRMDFWMMFIVSYVFDKYYIKNKMLF